MIRARRSCERLGGARRRRAATPALTGPGTFHAVANRLLRLHAAEIGLDAGVHVLDRADAADLLDVVRHERGLARTERRFPRKGTCLAIYSRAVNAQEPLRAVPARPRSPGASSGGAELRELFARLRRGQAARARARLRRPAALLVPPDERRRAGGARSARASITCWSTSTRTPTRSRRRSCAALKPDGRGRHRGRRRRAGDLRVSRRDACATSSTFPRSSIRPRDGGRRSSRTIARRSRSSTRPTR